MNFAPIILATLAISSLAAGQQKLHEAELLEILSGDFTKVSGDGADVPSENSPYAAIDYAADYPTHSSTCINGSSCQCLSCEGRVAASSESTGESFCFERDGELQNTGVITADQLANKDVCDKYHGGSGTNTAEPLQWLACELSWNDIKDQPRCDAKLLNCCNDGTYTGADAPVTFSPTPVPTPVPTTPVPSTFAPVDYSTDYSTQIITGVCIDGEICQCIDCSGRTQASEEEGGDFNMNDLTQLFKSSCYRRDSELSGDQALDKATCAKYFGGAGGTGSAYEANPTLTPCVNAFKDKTGKSTCTTTPDLHCCGPTSSPTWTPTHSPTPTPTPTPTWTPTPSPTEVPTHEPTPSSLQYNAVATWPVPVWGAWPSSAGTQAFCVEASATAFTNPVDVSSMDHNEHKNTMFIQCCSLAGVASTRDCSSTEGRSWAEAKEFCDAKSERLCTTSELLLTWSKGCFVDGVDSRAWSSDSC